MRTITLCYRKVIDARATTPWEKLVFEDSYVEFQMQAQLFSPKNRNTTFSEILQNNPDAQRLHFLVSPSVIGYLKQMNGTIPDILNNLGKHFLKFSNFQFEIVNSHLTDMSKHQVAVNFYSEPLTWIDTIGDFLLVSEQSPSSAEFQTHLFQIQPYLTIQTLKQN